MTFVDTNYFLRFLLNDISPQHSKAKKLFRLGAVGDVELFTSVIVIFEIFWVMTTFYKKSKQEVILILKEVLTMKFIEFSESLVLQKTLNLYENSSLELEDCYNIQYAKSKGVTGFATFDKKLSKIL